MKIGRAEFTSDVHVPGLKVRRPVSLVSGQADRQPEAGKTLAGKVNVDLTIGEHIDQGVDPTWLVVTLDGKVTVLVPEPHIAALYPPEPEPEEEKLGPPNSTIIPGLAGSQSGGARPHPAQQGPKK